MDKEYISKLVAPRRRGPRSKAPDDITLLEQYQEKTGKQLAEMYNVPVATVRSWIRNARIRLKEGM